jgi:hypothetical protein
MYLTPSCDCNHGEKNVWCAIHGEEALNEKQKKQAHLAEMAEQDRIWKERRMVDGHGAQDGAARDPDYKSLIVFIGGPIKHWWDENWMSPEHLRYDDWRTQVEQALIAAGFLVYKPYTAWKGTWNEQAQFVNNVVVETVDVFLDLTPPGVPSAGTEAEVAHAELVGTPVLNCPPPIPGKTISDELMLKDLVKVLTYDADMKNARLRSRERSI